jgi:hypothetical protein
MAKKDLLISFEVSCTWEATFELDAHSVFTSSAICVAYTFLTDSQEAMKSMIKSSTMKGHAS